MHSHFIKIRNGHVCHTNLFVTWKQCLWLMLVGKYIKKKNYLHMWVIPMNVYRLSIVNKYMAMWLVYLVMWWWGEPHGVRVMVLQFSRDGHTDDAVVQKWIILKVMWWRRPASLLCVDQLLSMEWTTSMVVTVARRKLLGEERKPSCYGIQNKNGWKISYLTIVMLSLNAGKIYISDLQYAKLFNGATTQKRYPKLDEHSCSDNHHSLPFEN